MHAPRAVCTLCNEAPDSAETLHKSQTPFVQKWPRRGIGVGCIGGALAQIHNRHAVGASQDMLQAKNRSSATQQQKNLQQSHSTTIWYQGESLHCAHTARYF